VRSERGTTACAGGVLPASGKSRLAKRVGFLTGLMVVDTDKIITRDHGPIPEIFDSLGEPAFRALERVAVQEALGSAGIVSLGGGAVIDSDTRAELQEFPVALITISEDAVASRLTAGKRPLLRDGVTGWPRLLQSANSGTKRYQIVLSTRVIPRLMLWPRTSRNG